jgi:hypothetical protein
MLFIRCALIASLLGGLSRPSAADEVADSDIQQSRAALVAQIAKRSLARARRSLTLGPSISVAPLLTLDSNATDVQVSLGLDLLRYRIPPLPSPERMGELVKSRVRSEVARRLAARAVGGARPTSADRERIAREVWRDIKSELLLETQPRKLEKPGFALRLELDHMIDAGSWNVRLMAGIGVGPVFLSLGPGMEVDDGVALVFPIEISRPVLISRGLRSPVIEPFVRAEVVATDRSDREDRILVGARFLLDLI